MQRISPPSRKPTTLGLRAAFTLIELLIVISIILILMALITPAIQAVFSKAKDAEVRAEITGLTASVDKFKGVYTHHPPSYIVLSEKGGTWSSASKRMIRRIWGLEFDFNIDRHFNDDDGDGQIGDSDDDTNDMITLTGSECLVFFLGGIARQDSTTKLWELHGFSKSKANPFKLGGSNRIQHFTAWKTHLLRDDDRNGFPEYYDQFNEGTQGKPFVYVSTMRTGKYELLDLKRSGMTNVYLQSKSSGTTADRPWRPKSFQIISPGRDHKYGTGGLFNEDDGVSGTTNRFDEEDNFSNFTGLTLGR